MKGSDMTDEIAKLIELGDRKYEWTERSVYELRGFDNLGKTVKANDEVDQRLAQEDREWQTCLSEWAKRLSPLLPNGLATKLFKLAAQSIFVESTGDIRWPDVRAELQAWAASKGKSSPKPPTEDQEAVLAEIPFAPETKQAAAIAATLGTSPENVRTIIKRLREKGYKIENQAGAGYCRTA